MSSPAWSIVRSTGQAFWLRSDRWGERPAQEVFFANLADSEAAGDAVRKFVKQLGAEKAQAEKAKAANG